MRSAFLTVGQNKEKLKDKLEGGDNGKSEATAQDSFSCLEHASRDFEWATSYYMGPVL